MDTETKLPVHKSLICRFFLEKVLLVLTIHTWESRDLCYGKLPNEFGGVAPIKSKFKHNLFLDKILYYVS